MVFSTAATPCLYKGAVAIHWSKIFHNIGSAARLTLQGECCVGWAWMLAGGSPREAQRRVAWKD
jgi:hypothetical protein